MTHLRIAGGAECRRVGGTVVTYIIMNIRVPWKEEYIDRVSELLER